MAKHVGHRFLSDAKGRHGHFFGDAGEPLLALQAPAHLGVFQGLEQVRAQAGFQAQAGQLARVEDGTDVTHLGQGFIERIAQHRTMVLQILGQAALQPFTLQLGGCQ